MVGAEQRNHTKWAMARKNQKQFFSCVAGALVVWSLCSSLFLASGAVVCGHGHYIQSQSSTVATAHFAPPPLPTLAAMDQEWHSASHQHFWLSPFAQKAPLPRLVAMGNAALPVDVGAVFVLSRPSPTVLAIVKAPKTSPPLS